MREPVPAALNVGTRHRRGPFACLEVASDQGSVRLDDPGQSDPPVVVVPAKDGRRFFEHGVDALAVHRASIRALAHQRHRQVALVGGRPPAVASCRRQCNRLLLSFAGEFELTLDLPGCARPASGPGEVPSPGEAVGAQRRRRTRSRRDQRRLQQMSRLLSVTPDSPSVGDACRQAQRQHGVRPKGPVDGSADVVVFDLETGEPHQLLGATDARHDVIDQIVTPARMRGPGGPFVARFGEALNCVLPQGFEHPVPIAVPSEERLVDEVADGVFDVGLSRSSPAQTATAATRSKPPTNTASWRNSARSCSNSRS